MSYLLVTALLGLLIFVHELGHFMAARWTGIGVEVFSLGFGPKLWSVTRGGVEYRVSLIPFGGYVLPRLQDEDDWLRIALWKRILFAFGGPLANLLLALPLFALMNVLHGPATLYAIFVAPVAQTGTCLLQMVQALATVFDHPENLTGPLGIVTMGGAFVGLSVLRAVMFSVLLSLNLAIFNLLPLPPLDGGKIALDVLQRFFPKTAKIYVPAVLAGWLLMAVIFIYSTACDVARVA
jgi:regulator of sigma E protease